MKIFRTYLQVMTYIPEYICNQVLTFFILSFIKVSIYNPQIEMFARFKMKSSFHKTKRII